MIRIAAAALALTAIPALAAIAPDDSPRIASQYSSWAGSKANADALVNGLQNGTTVMLTTQTSSNTRSLAGFTPPSKMSPDEVASALARAKSTLASMGIRHPGADQIQAALIGGEVTLPDGRTRAIAGAVGTTSAVAAR